MEIINFDLLKNNKVVNWHEHVWQDSKGELNEKLLDMQMEHSAIVGVDTIVVSMPFFTHCSPETIEYGNSLVHKALNKYPDRLRGYVFVDPLLGRYAVKEIEHCVKDWGFVGVKLYHQFFIDDPAQYPIVEKCIDLDIPILMHAGKLNLDAQSQPRLSDSVHFINMAKRYPEAKFIMAHISGGGDWNWQLKGMKECPNVFTDISGSVFDAPMIEETAAVFGAERMLFGTDGSYSSCLGKILSADLPEKDKITILNNPQFERYLK